MQPLWWAAAGLVLVALEILLPGLFLVWFGAAAFLTGVAIWASGGWGLFPELGLFTVMAGAMVAYAMARHRRRNTPSAGAGPADINDRARQLVGKQAVLADPIVGGHGRIFMGDTLWQVEGPDRPAGTPVRVTGHKGMVLTVEPDGDRPTA